MTTGKNVPAQLTGRVIHPDSPAYTEARSDWDGLYRSYPLVIVFAKTTQDVVNAVTWARRSDVALRARSGRHSLEGWSNVSGGIVIDVSEMKSARLDPASRTVTVGPGFTQGEVISTLSEKGFAVATGGEASVGLAGATLGGGLGFFTRSYGMACDNVIAAEVVVPSGDDGAAAIIADEHNNSDLLWALRGAGNGNFGIVTSFTYRMHPLKQVSLVVARWAGFKDLRGVFDAWQRQAPTTDVRLSSVLDIGPDQIDLMAVLQSGPTAEARGLLAPVLSVGKPDVHVQTGSWADIFAQLQPPSKSAVEKAKNWKFFSQFVTAPYPAEAIDIVGKFMKNAPSEVSDYFCSSFGGAVKKAPRGARRSPTATRSSTPSRARAGVATRSRPRRRPGSPSSARRCGPTSTAHTSTCRTRAWPTGRPPTGVTTTPGCARSRPSTTPTTSFSTSRASGRPEHARHPDIRSDPLGRHRARVACVMVAEAARGGDVRAVHQQRPVRRVLVRVPDHHAPGVRDQPLLGHPF
jgi:hypothetical protein